MKKLSLLAVALIFLGFGCSSVVPEKMPADFSFVYYFSTATVPPPYHYEYTLTVDKDGKSKVRYVAGYENAKDVPQSKIWEEEFNFSTGDRETLYGWMKDKGVFNKQNTAVKENEIGGDYHSLKAKVAERDYNFSFSGADPKLLELFEKIEHLVPEDVWIKIGQKAQVGITGKN